MIFFKKSSQSSSKRSRSSREIRTLSGTNFRNPRTPIMCPTLFLEIPNATTISFVRCNDFRGSVLQRDLDEADHLQSQAFHFVFCHSNLLAPILHLLTALPGILLYSHQHTNHHKHLAFVCEFQLEEIFPRLRIQ